MTKKMTINEIAQRVSAARAATEARGETFYPGASRVHLAAFPPIERWDDWVELSSRAWPAREERHYMLVPTTCFNCESACGLLAYVDRDTRQVRKFEGNPEHPGSRGRNCAKGPATINQVTDPDRVLYPLRRAGRRGEGKWERISWDEALDAIAARIRQALARGPPQRDHGAHRAAPARTATPNGCWPAGASTGTTRTPTCAPAAAGPGSSSGWASTGPAPTTSTPRSST